MAQVNTLQVSGAASVASVPTEATHVVRKEDLDAKTYIPVANRPTSFTSTGKPGQWTCDGKYLYICWGTNKWVFRAVEGEGWPSDAPSLP